MINIKSEELFREASTYIGKEVSLDTLDSLFCDKYYWECMGFNIKRTKLYYIESPMGEELDVYIDYKDDAHIIIKDICKKYWE